MHSMFRIWRYVPFLLIIAFGSLLPFAKEVTFAAEIGTLVFYRATKDKAKYEKAPERYEHLVVSDAMGKREYYIERRPAHVVNERAIEAVFVEKTKMYGNSPEEQRELAEKVFGTKTKKGKSNTDYAWGFFTVSPSGLHVKKAND